MRAAAVTSGPRFHVPMGGSAQGLVQHGQEEQQQCLSHMALIHAEG